MIEYNKRNEKGGDEKALKGENKKLLTKYGKCGNIKETSCSYI